MLAPALSMNLRQIELFRAVVRCQTTVKAARELGLSQPAVSNAIKHLESQAGFPLFERVNNRLFPTAEARQLYQASDPISALHAALKVQDLRDSRAGHVGIIATPPLGYGVVPAALRAFLLRRPKVRISFDVRRFESVVESVETGGCRTGLRDGDRGRPWHRGRDDLRPRHGRRDAPRPPLGPAGRDHAG